MKIQTEILAGLWIKAASLLSSQHAVTTDGNNNRHRTWKLSYIHMSHDPWWFDKCLSSLSRLCVCWHYCFSLSLVGQIEVQYSCYQYVKACLLGIYSVTLASTDIITHSRHRQEWMKVSRVHFSPHDSQHAATFQGFRQAFFVTYLACNAATIVYNQNSKKSCWISCRVCSYESETRLLCWSRSVKLAHWKPFKFTRISRQISWGAFIGYSIDR